MAINVGIVDERGEIAAMYKGIPQNDIGIKTDIVENVSKNIGIRMLIRSMAPKVIVADEIGKKEDIEAIHYAVCSGCRGIFTAHGSNFEDISLNPVIHNLIETHTIERLIFLDEKEKGKVRELYALNRKNKAIFPILACYYAKYLLKCRNISGGILSINHWPAKSHEPAAESPDPDP